MVAYDINPSENYQMANDDRDTHNMLLHSQLYKYVNQKEARYCKYLQWLVAT